MGRFTIKNPGQTTIGTYISGQTTNIRLDYFADTTFVNGTLTIQLPSEITVATLDSVNFGEEWRFIKPSESSNDGHTLTFTGINGRGDFAISLGSKIIPTPGSYNIVALTDADGTGGSYSVDSKTVTLISE